MKAFAMACILFAACHEATNDPELGQVTDHGALACGTDGACDVGVCDPVARVCVDCVADSDCGDGAADGGARCHPRDHVCVQCLDDGDCGDGVCHPTRSLCVGCYDDTQCGGRGVCHPELLSCVECLADGDCGPGRSCNPRTFACVGQCTLDLDCADDDPCTDDRCAAGSCVYGAAASATPCDDRDACTVGDHCEAVGEAMACVGERAAGCCDPIGCGRDQAAVDGDADGCADTCVCPPSLPCPIHTVPVDADGGGCVDACRCPSGEVIGPDGTCGCAFELRCDGGLVASDLDGDTCPETCTKPCQSDCDCASQGLESAVDCPLACANCGPWLACEAGVCVGRCGVAPTCVCPDPPVCGALETAFDRDGDGCNDGCRCLVDGPDGCACPAIVECGPDAVPVDVDRDGCDDGCACDDPTRAPQPDGTCCPVFECPTAQFPAPDASGCPGVCVCADGSAPDPATGCPCKALDCEVGADAVDLDGDGCGDVCQCADGSSPGPAGCSVCLSVCAADPDERWLFYIDADGDGCYDATGECPIGSTADASPGAGCPDFCAPCPDLACPAGAHGVDGDGDRCPDACLCADGSDPNGADCRCQPVVCSPGAVPVDLDRDGCDESCRTPCVTACDCRAEGVCDCAGCRAAASCVDGFCTATCVATAPCAEPNDVTDGVCGCDGTTYASRCDANAAATDVAHAGACGLGCAMDGDCGAGERCEIDGCASGVAAPAGTCVATPTACLAANDPVCGCDGKTYANDCERLRAGVARASKGPCN